MLQLTNIRGYMEQFAPLVLAEEWDNVGLLAGDPESTVERVMTCLTVTPRSAEEAVQGDADLIITHHPLPFRGIKCMATTTTTGRLLWQLISHEIAIYSPHTAFDSAARGINQQLAEGLQLSDIAPLIQTDALPEGAGTGRIGSLATSVPLRHLAKRLQAFLGVEQLEFVGNLDAPVQRIAVACGAAGELLPAARQASCEVLVLGEAKFHTCLEAEANDVALLLPGHFASERFAVARLAKTLSSEFPELDVWASASESDPIGHFRG
ncbi:MAG: Nif3-like dinuclear metal center hexameric protein [Planctomycetota bacterium]